MNTSKKSLFFGWWTNVWRYKNEN